MESVGHPKKALYAVSKSILKLYGLCAEILLSPEGYGKSNLANGGRCYTRDYAMERSPTGVQQRPG
jgi:hypothetical protein